MKRFWAIILILFLFVIFTGFEYYRNLEKEVLNVITPVIIQVDLNNNKVFDEDENVCIADTQSFTSYLSYSNEKIAESLNISPKDSVALGYLADEFADKTLFNQKVKIKFNGKKDQNCRYAQVYVNKQNYSDILKNAGFGMSDGKPANNQKFNENLNKAKTFKLVILNHKSNKYHKLDCKYGLAAHDAIVIFVQQLPHGVSPCKFCHIDKKTKKLIKENKIPAYPLLISDGSLKLFLTDFTTKLKPDNNCDNLACKEILSQINSSKSRIDIAAYGWDSIPALENALLNAKRRGVTLRVVFDQMSGDKIYPETANLIKIADFSKGDLTDSKRNSGMLMHNKFIIIDNQRVITGSMNFSRTGISGFNANNMVLINSKEIASEYSQEFEQMLSGKFHKNKSKIQHKNYIIGDSKVTALFSPQDLITTNSLIPLIQNSKNYIYIPAFLITHNTLIDSLISAKKRGVNIKIITDATYSSSNNKRIKRLRENGILLKVENYAGKMHSKTLIIDDKYLVIGSMNFSYAGEVKNDENVLIIENRRLAKYYKGYFDYIWQKIPERYLKHGVRAEGKYSIGSCSDGIDNNYDGKIDKEDAGCH